MAGIGASGSAPSKQTQKIMNDFKALEDAKLPFLKGLQLGSADGLNKLEGTMRGPDGTPYAGGHFKFAVQFPPEYPFKPPDFAFITKVCHPNVDSQRGTACHDELMATWSPRVKLFEFLTKIYSLLEKPHYELQIQGETMTNKSPELALQWTQQYALPQN